MKRCCAAVVFAICLVWQMAWSQSVGEQIIAALERYRLAVVEFDIEHQVSSFTEDAELALAGEPVVQGRTTIRALLSAQGAVKVVAFDLHAAATRVQGNTAIQNGIYAQRIITPEHQSILSKGVFEVDWLHQADGTWLISSLHLNAVE